MNELKLYNAMKRTRLEYGSLSVSLEVLLRLYRDYIGYYPSIWNSCSVREMNEFPDMKKFFNVRN